jgi:hypothetical protein
LIGKLSVKPPFSIAVLVTGGFEPWQSPSISQPSPRDTSDVY